MSGENKDLMKEIPKILNVSLTTVNLKFKKDKIVSVEIESDNKHLEGKKHMMTTHVDKMV